MNQENKNQNAPLTVVEKIKWGTLRLFKKREYEDFYEPKDDNKVVKKFFHVSRKYLWWSDTTGRIIIFPFMVIFYLLRLDKVNWERMVPGWITVNPHTFLIVLFTVVLILAWFLWPSLP